MGTELTKSKSNRNLKGARLMYTTERLKNLTYLVSENEKRIQVAIRGEYTVQHLDYEDIQRIGSLYGVELSETSRCGYNITDVFNNGDRIIKFIK